MKYMIMMNTMKSGAHATILSWPKADIDAHIGYMIAMNEQLKANGEFVQAEGLSWPDQAVQVRAGAEGRPITDGVFPESKEFLAGFWIVDVETPERAFEIAAKASAAPGQGGVPMNMPIEVRPVPAGPPR